MCVLTLFVQMVTLFFFKDMKFILFALLLSVDDVQVSCYRILNSLYILGTNKSIYVERYSMPANTHL